MFQRKDYIYTIYREKSFSKAAGKLFISQPSLSAIIKKQEEEIGLEIFDRSCNPIQLTEFGHKYIEAVKKINAMEKELANYVSDTNNLKTGSISLGSNHLYVSCVLPSYVFRFMQKYPHIQLSLLESSTENLGKKLAANELDMIIDNKELSGDLYGKRYFGTEYLLLAVPAAYPCNERAREYRMTHQDILDGRHLDPELPAVPLPLFKDVPFIIMTPGNDTRSRTNEIFRYYSFSPKIALELNQLSTIFNIASAGSAACIASDTLVKHTDHRIENVWFYMLPPQLGRRDVYFQYKKNRYLTKAAEAFIDTCIPHALSPEG